MITSTKNPRIVAVRKLSQRKHRLQQNRFVVEGLQLLGMAVQAMSSPAPYRQVIPQEVFYSEALFTGPTAPKLLAQLVEAGAEAAQVDTRVLNSLSDRDTSQGIIATFALAELEAPLNKLEEIVSRIGIVDPSSAGFVLIVDKLQDPGNLGTLIRTADSVAAQAVILLEPCVDPFDTKTVRSTMGSIFTVPFFRTADVETCLTRISGLGYRLVGADAVRGKIVWTTNALGGSAALVLGNEARGLSPELQAYLDDYVSLPLLGHAESLNVAVAGGTLMYEWLRVNHHPQPV